MAELSAFGCSSSRHLRESTLPGLFAYTDFDLINLHLGCCGDCAFSRQDQESSRQHFSILFWCLLWRRLDKANVGSFASFCFWTRFRHHSPIVFEGGGFQRVMGSQLLDEGAPGSLRFFGVWNCLLHLGHMFKFRRSAQAWKFCGRRKCQDLKIFLDKKNGFKTLTVLLTFRLKLSCTHCFCRLSSLSFQTALCASAWGFYRTYRQLGLYPPVPWQLLDFIRRAYRNQVTWNVKTYTEIQPASPTYKEPRKGRIQPEVSAFEFVCAPQLELTESLPHIATFIWFYPINPYLSSYRWL